MSGYDSSGNRSLPNQESVDDALMDQIQAEFDELLGDSHKPPLMPPDSLDVPTDMPSHQALQENTLVDEGDAQPHGVTDDSDVPQVDHLSDAAPADPFEYSDPMPDTNDHGAVELDVPEHIHAAMPEQVQGDTPSSPEEFFADLGQEFSQIDQDDAVHSYSQNPFSDGMPASAAGEAAPVYADLSGGDAGSGSNMRVIAVVCSLLVITAGVIYWFVMSPAEQPEPLLASQINHPDQTQGSAQQEDKIKASDAGLAVHQDLSPSVAAIEQPPVAKATHPVVQPPVEHVEPDQVNPGADLATVKPMPSPNVHAVAVKKTTMKPMALATIEKTEADYLAAQKASAERMAMQAPVKKIVVIKPSTPLHRVMHQPKRRPVATSNARDAGHWGVFLMSVSSEKLARQLVARIDTMGVHGEIVRSSKKGKVYHRILIPGFSSHTKAQQQRDVVAKRLRLHNAKVVAM